MVLTVDTSVMRTYGFTLLHVQILSTLLEGDRMTNAEMVRQLDSPDYTRQAIWLALKSMTRKGYLWFNQESTRYRISAKGKSVLRKVTTKR